MKCVIVFKLLNRNGSTLTGRIHDKVYKPFRGLDSYSKKITGHVIAFVLLP